MPLLTKSTLQLWGKVVLSATIKYMLMGSEFQRIIADRIEVTTPLNSWKRATEAIHIHNNGVDPYMGDSFHDTPLNLALYAFLVAYLDSNALRLLFILCDTISAWLLYFVASKYVEDLLIRQEKNVKDNRYNKNSSFLLLSAKQLQNVPNWVLTLFLFNPLLICNCVGRTTTVFTNFYLALGYFGMMYHATFLSCVAFALATSQALYPAVLIIPVAFYHAQNRHKVGDGSDTIGKFRLLDFIRTICIYLTCLLAISYASYRLYDSSWSYADNVYGVILKLSDLRPNIGIGWYFFTEMFDHFHLLFICAFQINVCMLYVIPLAIRLHHDAMLLAVCFHAITVIFRSYPCAGDVGFYLSLFPMWQHLFPFMQQNFIVCCIFIISSVIAPVFWHLWIYAGAANANFYFGITLAFAVGQIFFVTDMLFAYIKRNYFLRHGFDKNSLLRFK